MDPAEEVAADGPWRVAAIAGDDQRPVRCQIDQRADDGRAGVGLQVEHVARVDVGRWLDKAI